MEEPPETSRAVYRNKKLCNVASRWLPLEYIYDARTPESQKYLISLCFVHGRLHVSTTSGHPQEVNVHKIKIVFRISVAVGQIEIPVALLQNSCE